MRTIVPEKLSAATASAQLLQADVAVIGGGIVGLGIAWEVQRSGRTVTVIDPAPATGATFAAAGMLAPVSELHYQEEALLELTLASAARWPEFIAPLTTASEPASESGRQINDPVTSQRDRQRGGLSSCQAGFRTTPTLVLGADAADRRALADLREVQRQHGLEVEVLSIRQARAAEPLVGPQISCAFRIKADHQVDPRGTAAAIRTRLAESAADQGRTGPEQTFIAQTAAGLLWDARSDAEPHTRPDAGPPAGRQGRVTGVVLADGRTVHAREVIVANGLGAPSLAGLPEGLQLPLRPVYGDILRLRVPEHLRPLATNTIRGLVRGLPVYIVPRDDGTVVIGATSREDGSAGVSAGGVHQLLRDAQVLLPAVAELELLECTARARPGTPDNAPLLGRVSDGGGKDIPGLIIATGFFRHGVLLTPIAATICRQLLGGIKDLAWERFRPDRFSPTLHPAHVTEPISQEPS